MLERKRLAVTPERQSEARRRMLSAVESLLDGPRSYPDLSVRELLEAGAMSRQTFYVHFEDKGVLLAELADGVVTELVQSSQSFWTLPSSPTRADLSERMRPVFEVYRKHGKLLLALADTAGTDARVREKLHSLVQMASAAFAVAIQNGQARGDIRAELDAARTAPWLIWMAERGLAQLAVQNDHGAVDDAFEGLVDVLWFTLYRQADRAPRA